MGRKNRHKTHNGFGGHYQRDLAIPVAEKLAREQKAVKKGRMGNVISRHNSAMKRVKEVCVNNSFFGAVKGKRRSGDDNDVSAGAQHPSFRKEGQKVDSSHTHGLNTHLVDMAMRLCLTSELSSRNTIADTRDSNLPEQLGDLRKKTKVYQSERAERIDEPVRGLAAISPTRPSRGAPSSSMRSPRKGGTASRLQYQMESTMPGSQWVIEGGADEYNSLDLVESRLQSGIVGNPSVNLPVNSSPTAPPPIHTGHLSQITEKSSGDGPMEAAKFSSIKAFLKTLLKSKRTSDDKGIRALATSEDELEKTITNTFFKKAVITDEVAKDSDSPSSARGMKLKLFQSGKTSDHRPQSESVENALTVPRLGKTESHNVTMRRQKFMDETNSEVANNNPEEQSALFVDTEAIEDAEDGAQHHATPEELMITCIQEERRSFEDSQRILAAEYLLLFNGFCILDSDKDGLLSQQDFSRFLKKYKCKPMLPQEEIDFLIWNIDEDLSGSLRFHDFRELYTRVRREIFERVDLKLAALKEAKSYAFKNKKGSPGAASGNNKLPLDDPARRQSESWMLVRILAFAAIQNKNGVVHHLTALEQLIKSFDKNADRMFLFIFGADPSTLIDRDVTTLSDFISKLREEDRHYLRSTPLSMKEKRALYDKQVREEMGEELRKPSPPKHSRSWR